MEMRLGLARERERASEERDRDRPNHRWPHRKWMTFCISGRFSKLDPQRDGGRREKRREDIFGQDLMEYWVGRLYFGQDLSRYEVCVEDRLTNLP